LLAVSEHRAEHGRRLFGQAQKQGLEGIMAKRAASPYLSGQRSGDWLKIKTAQRQEVVIAGFTAPRRSRPYFGSLVLAVREDKGWRYIGHVGTGFTQATLRDLYDRLLPLSTERSPFKERVRAEAATTWVKPKLVAEVKFAEWTGAGELRHPAFIGLRQDKEAKDVLREKASPRKRR
jgi:bifunctional non-homologous end joining protein LigD